MREVFHSPNNFAIFRLISRDLYHRQGRTMTAIIASIGFLQHNHIWLFFKKHVQTTLGIYNLTKFRNLQSTFLSLLTELATYKVLFSKMGEANLRLWTFMLGPCKPACRLPLCYIFQTFWNTCDEPLFQTVSLCTDRIYAPRLFWHICGVAALTENEASIHVLSWNSNCK